MCPDTAPRAVVRARGLVKRYGDFVAVDGIDLDVHAGECFGMLGPNGAGKTSTMRMIGCVSPVTAGSLEVLGLDVTAPGTPREIKGRIGVVPQDDALDDELTVEENLVVYAGYFGIGRRRSARRARELLAFMSLAERADATVRTLSGGMRRRLVIARALVNEPEVILLDEPTTGLDPQARHHIWDRLRSLRDEGATLVLTTHYMEEAARLCDRLVIMDDARVLVEGAPAELVRAHVPRHVVEIPLQLLDGRLEAVTARAGEHGDVQQLGDRLVIATDDGRATVDTVVGTGVDEGAVQFRMATLEDVFLRLAGRGIAGEAVEA